MTIIDPTEMFLHRVCQPIRDSCWDYWDAILQGVSP